MKQSEFDALLNCIKLLSKRTVAFPEAGEQNRHHLFARQDKSEQFDLIINRKGHYNKNNLTYQMNSHTLKGALVRLDCNGAPHDDVPTPHLHIFDEEHDNGRIAIGLENLEVDLATELLDSLYYFLDLTHVDYTGVELPII